MSPFDRLKTLIADPDMAAIIRKGLIGEGVVIPSDNGDRPLVYADYVASGRALRQVEDVIRDRVLPFYANTHSETSFVGAYMTHLREEARGIIEAALKVPPTHGMLFCGNGATAGLNRIVRLVDLENTARTSRAVVLVGPYEHHSNILPWRESGAEVSEIPEGPDGGPDPEALETALKGAAGASLVIGSFSAASNVTGTFTDVDRVTRMLKRYGAMAVWDYACAGPYVPITVGQGLARKDAIVISAHKYTGGPGASGILVINREFARLKAPSHPGGGTVEFVSPWGHDYYDDLIEREEGGTPNILGDVRAAMAILIRDMVDTDWLKSRLETLRQRALAAWKDVPGLTVLGHEPGHEALPVFSLILHDAAGRPVNAERAARMMSDLYGLQVRGGCSCAGPYGHRLLGIEQAELEKIRARVLAGEAAKPGWVRLNLSPYLEDAKADWIIDTVAEFGRMLSETDGVCAREPAV